MLLIAACGFTPVYGPDGKQWSTSTINPFAKPGSKSSKGLFAKGKPAGIFLPHDDDGNVIKDRTKEAERRYGKRDELRRREECILYCC